jgi:hypothetical protein
MRAATMLAYKAWRESRGRFLAGAAALTFFCVLTATADLSLYPPYERPTYAQFVWRRVYDGNIRLVFVLLTVMLGLGGLRREQATGTAAFTLALPVGRRRLDWTRAAVGFLEMAALACIPLLIVPTVSPHYQEIPYPVTQALPFAVLAVACGAAWLAAGFCWSAALGNEHTTAAASLATPFVAMAAVSAPGLKTFPGIDLFNVMSGRDLPYLDQEAQVFIGPLPWMTLGIVVTVAAGLVVFATRRNERRDF